MGFLFEASESDHCLQVPLGILLPGGPHANWALGSTSPASCASQSLLVHLSLLFPCTAEGGRSLAVRGRFLRPLPPSISLCSGVGGGSVSVVRRGARAPGCSPLLAPARIPQVLGRPVDTPRGAHTTQGPCPQGKAEPEGGQRQAQLQEGKAEGLYLGGLLSPREADSG